MKECSRRRQSVTQLLLLDRPSSRASAKKRSVAEGGARLWGALHKTLCNRNFGRTIGE